LPPPTSYLAKPNSVILDTILFITSQESNVSRTKDGQVTFRYEDYADDHQQKKMTLTAEEFLRRFVQHVLPKAFVKVRHYGLLANRQRAVRLEQCQRLLLVENMAAALVGNAEVTVEAVEPHGCPKCGGIRLVYREWTAEESPARGATMVQDSS
jgi:hypothetical protein